MASNTITLWQIEGEKVGTVPDAIFLSSKITVDGDYSHEIKNKTKQKTLAPWKKSYDKPRQCLKKQRHHFANKGSCGQGCSLSISHVWMWELNCEEWKALKNWYFWTVVLEKTPEGPLDRKEIRSVHPKGNQPWILIGRTDAEAEAPILWLPDGKSWLTGKDPDVGKDWSSRRREWQRMRWLDGFNGRKLGQTPGEGEGQGGLACCSPWDREESDTTWELNTHIQELLGYLSYEYYFLVNIICPKLEKAMAPHSSTLAWKLPWAEQPGRLQFMGSRRVGHNWATSLSRFTFMHWRRKWQPTSVFLPGESHWRGSLVGCHLWGCTDSDTTEAT